MQQRGPVGRGDPRIRLNPEISCPANISWFLSDEYFIGELYDFGTASNPNGRGMQIGVLRDCGAGGKDQAAWCAGVTL
jgi:hypothetical protein